MSPSLSVPKPSMAFPVEGLRENMHFLLLEVSNQLEATREFLTDPSHKLFDKIVSRDDYIDNLKNIIEDKCFSGTHRDKELTKREVNLIRSTQIICVNLERIADFCVNIVRQMGYLRHPDFLCRFDLDPMFDHIRDSLLALQPARDKGDLGKALGICRAEYELDELYKANFDRIMAELRTGLGVEDLITALFIVRYLERIGDSLLNIGEALILAIVGEKIKIQQFDALSRTLRQSGIDTPLSDMDVQSIWGGRSGCRISRVSNREDGATAAQVGIFKEGNIRKVRRERENIESWDRIFPGIGPKVFSYHEDGENASMLVEFLQGCTLDEMVITSPEDVLANALFVLESTLSEIWATTRIEGVAPVDSMRQLRSRLPAVFQVHPKLYRRHSCIGATTILSTDELLDACARIEARLAAPHTVFTHGDFNLNNIVYDTETQRLHFVDLYRSGRGDFVQDVSVFLVSNFRIPVFDRGIRARINRVIAQFHAFAGSFASNNGDATYEARLCLALGRSFQTSARFEMQSDFAREMFLRGVYLLEKLLRHGDTPFETFRLPEEVLYYS